MPSIVTEIRDNLRAALLHIDPANTNAPIGTRNYLTTPTDVLDRVETPEQVEGPDRPFLGIRKRSWSAGPKAFLESRDEARWDVFIYPELNLDDDGGDMTDTRQQLQEMIADVKAAVYRDIRLQNRVTFTEIDGVDDDEGDFAQRGYGRVGIRTVYHHSIGEI